MANTDGTALALISLAAVEAMTDAECAQLKLRITELETQLKKIKGALRDRLITYAEHNGETDDRGSIKATLDGATVRKQRRVSYKLDPDKVRALSTLRSVPLDKFGHFEFTPDMEALEALMAAGTISADDLKSCVVHKETFALRVTRRKDK